MLKLPLLWFVSMLLLPLVDCCFMVFHGAMSYNC